MKHALLDIQSAQLDQGIACIDLLVVDPKECSNQPTIETLYVQALNWGTSRPYFQGLYLEQAMSPHVWPSGHNGNVAGV